jgi:hypothetical protein
MRFAGPSGWMYLTGQMPPPPEVKSPGNKPIPFVLFACSPKCRDDMFRVVGAL